MDIVNAAGADQGKIQIAGAGAITDPADAGALKAFIATRHATIDPRSADGRTIYAPVLTGAETPVFAQAVLNNQPLATHATAVLLQFLRGCKGSALDDAAGAGA